MTDSLGASTDGRQSAPGSVFFKLPRASLDIASVRYRALLPAVALQAETDLKVISSDDPAAFRSGRSRALVLVKGFSEVDRLLATRASAGASPVILDLCDNLFVEGYKTKSPLPARLAFAQFASFADLIVVPTETLRQFMLKNTTPGTEVLVIPDGIETPAILQAERRLLALSRKSWQGRLRDKLRHGRKRVRAILRRALPGAQAPVNAPVDAQVSIKPPPAEQVAPAPQPKRLLWYGNYGAPYASFGLSDLLVFKSALESVAKQFDVELVVISNNQSKFDQIASEIKINSRYLEWSNEAVDLELKRASIVLVPNSLDEFASCKSANRSVLALERGVPVVATPTQALLDLEGAVWTADPLEGMQTYLRDPARGLADAAHGTELSQQKFGSERIASLWHGALTRADEIRRSRTGQPVVGIVLDLTQDLDLAEPLVHACRQASMRVLMLVSDALAQQRDNRSVEKLISHRTPLVVLPLKFSKAEALAALGNVSCLVTCSESSLKPHRFANHLTLLAKKKGLPTATMQHGFENIGLTYTDSVHPIQDIVIEAKTIYTWCPVGALHPDVRPDIIKRCKPVGCPKPAHPKQASFAGLEQLNAPVVGIFENLHWHRYSQDYRDAFLAALLTACDQFRQVTFLVKPHPAGRWLTQRYKGPMPERPNLIVAHPSESPWSLYTAPQLFGSMSAVITTPSTVGFDAARYGLPVAIAAFKMELPQYEPLPLIHQSTDMTDFVGAVCGNPEQRAEVVAQSRQFIEQHDMGTDGAREIVLDIARQLNHPISKEVTQ